MGTGLGSRGSTTADASSSTPTTRRRAHSADPAFVLILILAVAGMLSMLGVAAANLWARSSRAATTGARALTQVCLALIVTAAIALAGIGMFLSATANGLAHHIPPAGARPRQAATGRQHPARHP
jgi:hypothetical protein